MKTMTQLTQPASFRSGHGARIMTMALVAFVLMAVQAGTARAQWGTSGANIYNTNSGNVGIGTNAPAAKLEISGNNALPRVTNTNATSYGGLELFEGGTLKFGLHTLGSASGSSFIGGANALQVWNYANGSMVFGTNSSERMRIDATGNVGIGTTSPASIFTVQTTGGDSSGDKYLRVKSTNSYTGLLLDPGQAGDAGWLILGGFPSAGDFSVREYGVANYLTIKKSTGNVGIGTAAPSYLLEVQGNAQWVARFKKTDATHGGIIIDAATGYNPNVAMSVNGAIKWYLNSNTANGDSLQFWEASGSNPRFTLTQAGNVGIGTASPNSQYKLDVNGNTNVTGNFNASGTITGGTIVAKYQDVAEWVESSEQLPAATVVVLDETKSNQVVASSHAYDTRVAGVVSAQPGITLGEKGENKVLVATTGRVKVMVDASNGPIQVGDLLVTSDIAGVAKKSEPLLLGGVPIHRPGTLIGKALEPLARARGEILVLLSLQ
jgi:hypothetical protein